MALDTQLIQEAIKSFGEEFRSRIADLGYNLTYGIARFDSLAIAARVQSKNPIPEAVKEQIEGILPQRYVYKGHEIPIKLAYMGIPKAL